MTNLNKEMIEIQTIELNGVIYTMTRPGYYYKRENGKTTRIKKDEWEQAWELSAGKQEREKKQKESDKQAEKSMNKKPRRKKDVAFEEERLPTLTAKQVDFIKHLPDTNFWEHGLDSTPWCDVLVEEIGGQFADKPMTVGAMISTLKEKGLLETGKQKVNGHMAKFLVLTEEGKEVASKLGLA